MSTQRLVSLCIKQTLTTAAQIELTTGWLVLDLCVIGRTRKKLVQNKMNFHSNCRCSESNYWRGTRTSNNGSNGLRIGGARGKAEKGRHLMTSSYSAYRDKIFFLSCLGMGYAVWFAEFVHSHVFRGFMEPQATIKQIQNTKFVFNFFLFLTTLKNIEYMQKLPTWDLVWKFEVGWVKAALFLHWH